MAQLMEEKKEEMDTKMEGSSTGLNHHVYIRSDQYGWIPARVLTIDQQTQKATVLVDHYEGETDMMESHGDGEGVQELTISLKDYPGGNLPLQNSSDTGQLQACEDMVDMPYMHEAAILYNLKHRHINAIPYTRSGDVIVAMNPYAWHHELYQPQLQQYYALKIMWEDFSSAVVEQGEHTKLRTPKGISPHVYETATLAYKGMALWNHPQSILVSGESGAGKTETVKICMDQIAALQRGQSSQGKGQTEVAQRVLDSNPLLESFGNAKTRRNDNSSRFGKYIKLQFDRKSPCPSPAVLAGSFCEVYLLEKNRVVRHDSEGERNYHIFYELLSAPDKAKTDIWDGLKGATPNRFKYVGESVTKSIEGVSDGDRFWKTMEGLEIVGIGQEDRKEIFRALCIVLQLGNMTFAPDPQDDEKSVISNKREFDQLSAIMGLDKEDLRTALTERTIVAAGESYKVPLTADAAKESCDALAKDIYEKLFLWLVQNINEHTRAENNYYNEMNPDMVFGTIALLDIFGFEAFQVNRFEQLCINYANEKLQSKFTEDCFKLIEIEYREEGIPLDSIEYSDNSDVLRLIEGKTGLLGMLNEECVRPQGNAATFVNKALSANKSSPYLIDNPMDRVGFGVHHYAGKVMYSGDDFVTRNQDRLPSDLKECASRVSNQIVANEYKAALLDTEAESQRSGRASGSSIMAKTVWTKYKIQLTQLMSDLQQTESRYIRCIKPNTLKKPLLCEHNLTISQLQSCGVVASATIARSAFPNRMEHQHVVDRFGAIWHRRNKMATTAKEKPKDAAEKAKAEVQALLSYALRRKLFKDPVSGKVNPGFVVGKTKTYFRAGALEFLEEDRINHLGRLATLIQRTFRAFVKRMWANAAAKELHFKKEQQRRKAEAKRKREEAEARERNEAEARENESFEKRMEAEWEAFNARMEEERRQLIEKLAEEDAELQARLDAEARELKERLEKEAEEHKRKLEEERKNWTFSESEQLADVQAEIAALRIQIDEKDRDFQEKMKSIEERQHELKKEIREYDKKTDGIYFCERDLHRQELFARTMLEEREKHIKLLEREKKRLEKNLEKTQKKKADLESLNESLEKRNAVASNAMHMTRRASLHVKDIIDEHQSAYKEAKAQNEFLLAEAAKEQERYTRLTECTLELQQTLAKMLEIIHDCKDKELRKAVMHEIMKATKDAYKQMKVVQKLKEEAKKNGDLQLSVSDFNQSWMIR